MATTAAAAAEWVLLTFSFNGALQSTHICKLFFVDEGVGKINRHILDIEFHDECEMRPRRRQVMASLGSRIFGCS